MRIIQSVFFLPVFFVALFSQSPCYAVPKPFPWTMFLPAITSSNGNMCGRDVLIADRYLVNNCGVAKDTVTGLEWQRCSVGQTWNAESKRCDGSTTPFNWYEAKDLSAAGGWRLPTVTELRSLVYCSSGDPAYFGMDQDYSHCNGDFTRPTIFVEVFPDVPYLNNIISSHYWSSTTNVEDPNMAWGVSFYKASVSGSGPKDTNGLSARLVRTAAFTPGQAWNVKTIDYETHRNSTNLADGVYMDKGAWKTSNWPNASNGSYRYLSVSVDPQRHGIAFWSVRIPKTGFYKIETTYLSGENRGADADYAVYVNATTAEAEDKTAKPVYSTIINQHSAILSNPWPSMGTYCLQANDISMLVEDGRDDSLSDAVDATRWTFVGAEYNSARCE